MSKKVLAIFGTSAPGIELGKPTFATRDVDRQLIDRIKKLTGLCQEHGLSEVRQPDQVSWGPYPKQEVYQWETGCEELVVLNGTFWFEAAVEHEDGHFETDNLATGEFIAAFEDAADGDRLVFCEPYVLEAFEESLADVEEVGRDRVRT